MDALLYDRKEILERLKKNRETHEAAYKDALEGYQEAVVTELGKAYELAKAGTEYITSLNQTKPEEHLKEYDRAIEMLSLAKNDQINLEEHEFTKYVLNVWNWSNQFRSVGARYGKSLALHME